MIQPIHKVLIFIILLAGLTACSSGPKEPVVSTPGDNPLVLQATEKDRIPAEEKIFIDKFRKALMTKDGKNLMALGYYENAVEQYKNELLPQAYDSLAKNDYTGAEIYIEPNDKAKRMGVVFTTLYVGDVVIKHDQSITKLPVGIHEGKYYLTTLANTEN